MIDDRQELSVPDDGWHNPPVASVECWRCGKTVLEPQRTCPFCLASLVAGDSSSVDADTAAQYQPLIRALKVYGVLLATTLVAGWLSSLLSDKRPDPNHTARLVIVGVTEFVDSILVLGTVLFAVRSFPMAPVSATSRIVAWAAAIPALGLMLGANLAYHYVFNTLLRIPAAGIKQFPPISVWVVFMFCVQPALIEELFFRHVAFLPLRALVGTHGAVVISAIMFGLAHVGMPFSIPVLMLLGLVLGYARTASGALWLPIILHGAHNTIVLLIERFA